MKHPNQLSTIHLFDPAFTEAMTFEAHDGGQLVSLRFGNSFTIISHNVDELLDELLATVDAVQRIIEENEQQTNNVPDRREIYDDINAQLRGRRDIAKESA